MEWWTSETRDCPLYIKIVFLNCYWAYTYTLCKKECKTELCAFFVECRFTIYKNQSINVLLSTATHACGISDCGILGINWLSHVIKRRSHQYNTTKTYKKYYFKKTNTHTYYYFVKLTTNYIKELMKVIFKMLLA